MASLFKQLLFSNEKSSKLQTTAKSGKASRRNSEIVTTVHDLADNQDDDNALTCQRDRRHSIPETGVNSSSTRDIQTLDTILEVCIFYLNDEI